MADRVIRLKSYCLGSKTKGDGEIVLLFEEKVGGKFTRVELTLDSYGVVHVVDEIRQRTKEQRDKWVANAEHIGVAR